MLRVTLVFRRWPLTKERLKVKFDIAHPRDPIDGAFAQFAGQGQDIGDHITQLLVPAWPSDPTFESGKPTVFPRATG
jgi:hypothetical protein